MAFIKGSRKKVFFDGRTIKGGGKTGPLRKNNFFWGSKKKMTTKLDYGGVGPLKKIGGLPIQSYLVLWNVKSKHHIENLGFKQLHT